jgi:hypothetical protein
VTDVYQSSEIEQTNRVVVSKTFEFISNKSYGLGLQEISRLRSSFRSKLETSLFDILVSFLLKSEAVSPGSAELCIKNIVNFGTKNKNIPSYRQMTSADLSLILQTFADVDTASLINSGLTMAGLKGKIALSSPSTKLDTDVLELTQGYVFNNIFPAFSIKPVSFVHPKIVCIDGLVENVSEIHHLLESAAKSKETIVAFFRGLSEEVSHTLKVNYDRGTVSFIPIIVKFDIDGANLLKDIALVSQGDVVSSLKGNLISSIGFDSLPRIDVASVSGSEVVIENKSVAGLVDLHIAQLQKKIFSAENEATVEALTKRIQRLGINQVSIHLADNKDKTKRSFMIDRCLRAIKCASTHGVAQLEDRIYPISTISSAEFYCQQLHETMNSMGMIIV